MAYTVKQVAKLSGVTIRTLHHYDEIGLLKPAYYGDNGYRYYEEEQLLLLQQILFFRELDFELEQIRKLLCSKGFDKISALKAHRGVLTARIVKSERLIQTIDHTLEHLTKGKKMSTKEMYSGFDPQKQAEYERYLTDRFGEGVKEHFAECAHNIKNWNHKDWEQSQKVFDSLCKRLVQAMEKKLLPGSETVQALIREHYEWLKNFWTPDADSYSGHAELIEDSELRNAYAKYDEALPKFVAEAIKLFSKKELS